MALPNSPGPDIAHKDDGPATLHDIMKDAIGYGLRARYQPENEIPHDLLVLLMQLKDDERRT